MKDFIKETHESYGMLGFSRITGSGEWPLFGSSIKHNNTITMTVKRAAVDRGLNHDWYYGKECLIEVELSQSQFAEAITSMNIGDGVPCTIRYVGNKKMEYCPFTNKRRQFEEEFKGEMTKTAKQASDLEKKAEKLLNSKKPLTVSEKKELANLMHSLVAFSTSTAPYVQKCFNEQMDKTVKEAKGEIEALVQHKVNTLGINSLKQLAEEAEGN